jgi:hypothetical protein
MVIVILGHLQESILCKKDLAERLGKARTTRYLNDRVRKMVVDGLIKFTIPERPKPTGEVTGEVRRLLLVSRGEMTRRQLQEALYLKSEENFRQLYLMPALLSGFIEMTIPDKPKSRLQKYRLTQKGVAFLQ